MQKIKDGKKRKKAQKKRCRKKTQKHTKNMLEKTQKDMIQENLDISAMVFRAIFDLLNKIALLILLRMYALYVKKKKRTKIENASKE